MPTHINDAARIKAMLMVTPNIDARTEEEIQVAVWMSNTPPHAVSTSHGPGEGVTEEIFWFDQKEQRWIRENRYSATHGEQTVKTHTLYNFTGWCFIQSRKDSETYPGSCIMYYVPPIIWLP